MYLHSRGDAAGDFFDGSAQADRGRARPALPDAGRRAGDHRADGLLSIQEVSMVGKRAKTSRRAGSTAPKSKSARRAKTPAKKAAAPPANVRRIRPLLQVVEGALDEMKAVN